MLERTIDEGKSQKEHIMEKTVLKKIIKAVRDLENRSRIKRFKVGLKKHE